ncbi:MAG: helix-turn-helix domain-containing protein [Desulfobacterales bacterium]|nr:helix-turn-helix domain-containing protein [Desulfobacterales bacterium]
MTLAEIVARNLKAKCGDTTQDEFAQNLGISRSVLARLEDVSPNTTIDTLEEIANALRCHVCDLLKATDPPGK